MTAALAPRQDRCRRSDLCGAHRGDSRSSSTARTRSTHPRCTVRPSTVVVSSPGSMECAQRTQVLRRERGSVMMRICVLPQVLTPPSPHTLSRARLNSSPYHTGRRCRGRAGCRYRVVRTRRRSVIPRSVAPAEAGVKVRDAERRGARCGRPRRAACALLTRKTFRLARRYRRRCKIGR